MRQVPVLEGKDLETMRRACKLGREAGGGGGPGPGDFPPRFRTPLAGSGHRCSLHAARRHRG